jgi:hypothetical protein
MLYIEIKTDLKKSKSKKEIKVIKIQIQLKIFQIVKIRYSDRNMRLF